MNVLLPLLLSLLVSVALPISAKELCSADQPALTEVRKNRSNSILGPLKIRDLERKHMIVIRETGEVLAFGYLNKEWKEFKAAMVPGDEIFLLTQNEKGFHMDGHALVRKGCVVRFLLRRIS